MTAALLADWNNPEWTLRVRLLVGVPAAAVAFGLYRAAVGLAAWNTGNPERLTRGQYLAGRVCLFALMAVAGFFVVAALNTNRNDACC